MKLNFGEFEKKVDNTLFKQILGLLRYLFNSIPNITYRVGLVSKFMNDPRVSHLSAAKRIPRHLKGMKDFSLVLPMYNRQNEDVIKAFSSSD